MKPFQKTKCVQLVSEVLSQKELSRTPVFLLSKEAWTRHKNFTCVYYSETINEETTSI